MIAILPIFIMLLIVGILIMLYRVIIISNRKFITSNQVYVILSGYFILLLVSLGIFIVSPYPESSVLNEKLDTENIPGMYSMFYDVTEEGIPIDEFEDYKENEWEFEFSGETLQLQFSGDETYDLPIIIQRKGLIDETVEVVVYSSPSSVGDIDLSSMIRPSEVRFLGGNMLEINEPSNSIDVVSFKQEFIFNQFSKDANEDGMFFGPRIEIGDSLVYIRIPNGVQIDAVDYLEIEYIN